MVVRHHALFHGSSTQNVTTSTFPFEDSATVRQNSPNSTNQADTMRALTLIALLLAAAGAGADTDSLTNQLRGCASLDKDSERLACYDALSGSLDERAERDFGREQERIAEEAPDSMQAKIDDIGEAAYGKLVFTLDNGQVWRQNDSTRVIWDEGDTVVVERALFGSFMMKKVGGARSMRVKRLK